MRKTKIFALATILAVFTGILLSCGPNIVDVSTDEGFEVVQNELLNFYFQYPSDWLINKNEAEISIFKNAEVTQKSNIGEEGEEYEFLAKPNISATALSLSPLQQNMTSEEYWQSYCLPLLQGLFEDVEVTAATDVTMAGYSAKRFDYSATITGIRMQYAQVFLINRGVVYTLTYTAAPEIFEENANAIDKAVETFMFK